MNRRHVEDVSSDSDSDSENSDLWEEAGDTNLVDPASPWVGGAIGLEGDVFPTSEFTTLMEGLNRLPSWTVFPNHLGSCLAAVVKLHSDETAGSPAPHVEQMIRQLVTEGVPSAFQKCMRDHNLVNWPTEIHDNIYLASLRLMDLLVLKVGGLRGTADKPGAEEEVGPLLRALADAFDSTAEFHDYHRQHARPAVAHQTSNEYAHPQRGAVMGDGETSEQEVNIWLVSFINYFGDEGGFQKFVDLLRAPETLSVTAICDILHPMSKVITHMTTLSRDAFAGTVRGVVAYLIESMKQGFGGASGSGGQQQQKAVESNFAQLSPVWTHAYDVLGGCAGWEVADEMIGGAQQLMVQLLLAHPSFNKQMTAVRETNRLLDRVKSRSTAGAGLPAKQASQWLLAVDILRKVVRSNIMHQKQYVTQVSAIVRFLLREGELSDRHVELIWVAAERPDTFEAVKNNIYDMVAELAREFSASQLDWLFGRFAGLQDKPPAEQRRVLELIRKLGEGDATGALGARVLGFLWGLFEADGGGAGGGQWGAGGELAPASSGPTEADVKHRVDVLAKMLRHYAGLGCPAAQVDAFIVKALGLVREEGRSVSAPLRLFRSLVENVIKPLAEQQGGAEGGAESVRQLLAHVEQEHGLLSMLVSSLEARMLRVRAGRGGQGQGQGQGQQQQQRAATTASSSGGGRDEEAAVVTAVVTEYVNAIFFVIKDGAVPLQWDVLERLWGCLVDGLEGQPEWAPLRETAVTLIALLFSNCPVETLRRLMAEKLCVLPTEGVSLPMFQCFKQAMQFLALNEGKYVQGPNNSAGAAGSFFRATMSLDIIGLDKLWDFTLGAEDLRVGLDGVQQLLSTYWCLGGALEPLTAEIRNGFLGRLLGQHLQDAAGVLCGGAGAEGGGGAARAHQVAAWRAERSLHLAKLFVDHVVGVQHPPGVLPHGATFHGTPVRVDLVVGAGAQGPGGKQMVHMVAAVHHNHYVRSLRAEVGRLLGWPASRIRMIHAGRELVADWQPLASFLPAACAQIQAVTAAEDHAVHAVGSTPNPLMHHVPSALLRGDPSWYDVLFRLGDCEHGGVEAQAGTLLDTLPTWAAEEGRFRALLEDGDMDGLRPLLEGCRPRKLLYKLRVLQSLLVPVELGWPHASGDAALEEVARAAAQRREAFREGGGIPLLLELVRPEGLPTGTRDRIRGGLWVCALHVLRMLLVPPTPPTAAPAPGPAAAASDDDDVVEVDGPGPTPRNSAADPAGNHRVAVLPAPTPVPVEAAAAAFAEVEVDSDGTAGGGGGDAETGSGDGSGATAPWAPPLEARPPPPMTLEVAIFLAAVAAVRPSASGGVVGGGGQLQAWMWQQAGQAAYGEAAVAAAEGAHAAQEAIALLQAALRLAPPLVDQFLACPGAVAGLVGSLIQSPQAVVRDRAGGCLLSLAAPRPGGNADAAAALLGECLGRRVEAESLPSQCGEYFLFLCRLLETTTAAAPPSAPAFLVTARAQLDAELRELPTAPRAERADDFRLCGRLQLLSHLARACPDSEGERGGWAAALLRILMLEFLFPAAEGARAPAEDPGLGCNLQPRCGTQRSRELAYDLALEVACGSPDAFSLAVDLVGRLHAYTDRDEDAWGYRPSCGPKPPGKFVGLRNGGATCYMNSVFQQLFMQPEIRRNVLASRVDERADSVLFQVQHMFGSLQASALGHYEPHGFWLAFKDWDGRPVNVGEHQDAHEFLQRLQDQLDSHLTGSKPKQAPALESVLGGKTTQQVISKQCPHRSERVEDFSCVSVEVRGKPTLQESLASYVLGELLEGENAYACDQCAKGPDGKDAKVDAVKRLGFSQLPPTLMVHLKRFEYDFETMNRYKIEDRFEFPVELDMFPYTLEGLELADRDAAAAAGGEAGPVGRADVTPHPASHYQYRLVGVVIHSGSAFAGHYYSLIRAREWRTAGEGAQPPSGPAEAGVGPEGGPTGWWCFDDKRVEPYDMTASMERDCFGGKHSTEVWDNVAKCHVPSQVDRPNSAYMLLYERVGSPPAPPQPPIEEKDEEGAAAGGEGEGEDMEVVMIGPAPPDDPLELPARIEGDVRAPVPVPRTILRSVARISTRFVHEGHLYDVAYFSFVHRLASSVPEESRRKVRRRMESGAADGGSGYAMGERSAAEALASVSVDLATDFLFRVYLRAHPSLRSDMSEWRLTLKRLLETQPVFTRGVISTLVSHPEWLRAYLLRCRADDIRMLTSDFLWCAVMNACTRDDGLEAWRVGEGYGGMMAQEHAPGGGRQGESAARCVDQLVQCLSQLLAEAMQQGDSFLGELLGLLRKYATWKDECRAHLLQTDVLDILLGLLVRMHPPPRGGSGGGLGTDHRTNWSPTVTDTVSTLVRSLDVSGPAGSMSPSRAAVEGAGDKHSPRALRLPRRMAISPARQRAVYSAELVSSLVDGAVEQAPVRELLEFLCWENAEMSSRVMAEVGYALRTEESLSDGRLEALMTLVREQVGIDDTQRCWRVRCVLLGRAMQPVGDGVGGGGRGWAEAPAQHPSLMDVASDSEVSHRVRYVVLRTLHGLATQVHEVLLVLQRFATQWGAACDLMEEGLQGESGGGCGALNLRDLRSTCL